ncbi:5-oxoprolinase subunit C family protein [Winogradskyella jejuensis]|uniref:Biotin-dependent carboxylase uncharacterized domain-containing protein n=1 Tax=Winogradskyella jejuensis TaxID=1089305 RepID=A0A1M5T965_9FLAO|nr:biotin-dependent carboxyltransferase family protein [Winogradskyella jejuensis]SHH47254.1 biotin-dependent carboxylase uncharacterized domain-containing protein [Winogradskyella jejuensis]
MIKVLKSGLLSSIQDLGRFSYREFGVPFSGAMDSFSFEMANALLGNTKDDAALEMTMIGAKLQFLVSTQLVITGADMSPTINGRKVFNNQVTTVAEGDILSFGSLKNGLRTYLGVKGGIKTDVVLGSRSFYDGITKINAIREGDMLRIEASIINNHSKQGYSKLKPHDFSLNLIEAFKGPEYDLLSSEQKEKLKIGEFEISNLYDRMAYQLTPNLENDLPSILTGPVLSGTVQLTPSGRLIVLMRDCQTTGGYPRVLQLTERAINLLSQKKERDKVSFVLRKD